jgi:TetR/AcrR family transcriptional regulator, regulator of cefoperazone and chloramphenicol sensitivity
VRAALHDQDTRARLVEAGRALFAERGFEDVTVRDICAAADANVALVSYHFGDKQGLYMEIAREAVAHLREFNERLEQAPHGSTAEEKLAHFVRIFLTRVLDPRRQEGWVHKLMQHELARPTEAAVVIGREAIAPRILYLGGVVAELLHCNPGDPRVGRCVASVHGLCLGYSRMMQAPKAFKEAVPELVMPKSLDPEEQVRHVVAFSLAGIAAIRAAG